MELEDLLTEYVNIKNIIAEQQDRLKDISNRISTVLQAHPEKCFTGSLLQAKITSVTSRVLNQKKATDLILEAYDELVLKGLFELKVSERLTVSAVKEKKKAKKK